MKADRARPSVQELGKHMNRINVLSAACRRMVRFAELQRRHFKISFNGSSHDICNIHLMRLSAPLPV